MQSPTTLVSRHELASLTGVGDDVLSFWIKSRLIQATAGGNGRGHHRRFDLFQVNIAAVLAELRCYGVNIATLRALSSLLQRGTALAQGAECNFFALAEAIDLAHDLRRFRAGEVANVANEAALPIPHDFASAKAVNAYYASLDRPAVSEDEIVANLRARREELHDDPEAIVAFALRIGEGDILPLELFRDLNQTAYRYVYGDRLSEWGNSDWLIVPDVNDGLSIYRAPEGHDLLGRESGKVRSGLFIAPGTIFRDTWGSDLQPVLVYEPRRSPETLARRREIELNAMRRRERLQADKA